MAPTHGDASDLRRIPDADLTARRAALYAKLEEDAALGRAYDWNTASWAALFWEEQQRRASLSAHQRLAEARERMEQ